VDWLGIYIYRVTTKNTPEYFLSGSALSQRKRKLKRIKKKNENYLKISMYKEFWQGHSFE
jgi:hypothetical protein